jgi:hypothetical protein
MFGVNVEREMSLVAAASEGNGKELPPGGAPVARTF